MFMNPIIRRTIILLESIPQSAREKLRFVWVGWTDDKGRPKISSQTSKMMKVDIAGNVLQLAGICFQTLGTTSVVDGLLAFLEEILEVHRFLRVGSFWLGLRAYRILSARHRIASRVPRGGRPPSIPRR